MQIPHLERKVVIMLPKYLAADSTCWYKVMGFQAKLREVLEQTIQKSQDVLQLGVQKYFYNNYPHSCYLLLLLLLGHDNVGLQMDV